MRDAVASEETIQNLPKKSRRTRASRNWGGSEFISKAGSGIAGSLIMLAAVLESLVSVDKAETSFGELESLKLQI